MSSNHRSVPHSVSDHRVWVVQGNRKDNGNKIYYRVWADNADLAEQYLRTHDLKGIDVTFHPTRPLENGTYEMTVNCYNDHPERYDNTGLFDGEGSIFQ